MARAGRRTEGCAVGLPVTRGGASVAKATQDRLRPQPQRLFIFQFLFGFFFGCFSFFFFFVRSFVCLVVGILFIISCEVNWVGI